MEEKTEVKNLIVKTIPNDQNVFDIFKGSWRTQFDDHESGWNKEIMGDTRIDFFCENFDSEDSTLEMNVLDLGPFEGYQTIQLSEKFKNVTSIEANRINFLKCLCVQNVYNLLNTKFLIGNFEKFLENNQTKYDAIFASGVLYHLQEPHLFIKQLARNAEKYIFIWTHFYDEGNVNNTRHTFLKNFNKKIVVNDREITLYAKSYNIHPDYENNIPQYWEGGIEDLTFWLKKEDLLYLFEINNLEIVKDYYDIAKDTHHLPCASYVLKK